MLAIPSGGETASADHGATPGHPFAWFQYRSVPTNFFELTERGSTAASEAIDLINTQTAMHYYKVAEHPASFNSLTVVDGGYPDDWDGLWDCVERRFVWDYGDFCAHGHIFFNTRLMPGTYTDYWKHVACHEFGHSASLTHQPGNASCVDQPESNHEAVSYTEHDVATINANVVPLP